ncbi:MAG: biopolymer transporter ExbD [Victivallales bacterium]|nr:biopolymer transporter ExbD [Victivallales bacterium]
MFVWRNQINYEPNNFPAVVGLMSVILVLLLIFYISSTQVSMPGTTVNLPQMDQVTNHTHAKKLIVTVTGDSEFFFNGKRFTVTQADASQSSNWNSFRQELSSHVGGHSSGEEEAEVMGSRHRDLIVVCADRNISLQTWLELAQSARELGLDIYLATQPQPEGPAVNVTPKIDNTTD